MSKVIIYHKSCVDGYCAAWLTHKAFNGEQLEYIACQYQEKINDQLDERIKGKDVLVFDFSFPRETMERYNSICTTFEVYDHHESVMKNCAGLPFCTFDLSKSGAMLAWETLFPNKPPPLLVEYVQDYDLWKFKLPDSKEINAAIHAGEMTFNQYEIFHQLLQHENGRLKLVDQGKILIKEENRRIDIAVKNAALCVIDGIEVPIINNPEKVIISKAGEKLSENYPFAVIMFMTAEGDFVFGLRSNKNNPNAVDVGALADKFGGGGHRHAAGFKVKINEFVNIHNTIKPMPSKDQS
jgi:uncharacterized protein